MSQQLLEKLADKKALIGIVGLGYVGLPLVLRYSQIGYQVLGLDIDEQKTGMLSRGESYIERIDNHLIAKAKENGFEASTDFSRARDCDALIICVPTPLTKHREPDLSLVRNAMERLQPYIHEGMVVSLESTTYPGTTEEEIKPVLESMGLQTGKDIALVYSPEREDPGNLNYHTSNIPKIVGGSTPFCLEAGLALYAHAIEEVVPVSSLKTAEMTKLLENIHRSVNIGLVNEMKIVADKMGIDIHEVIRAASTKPFGFTPYQPGPGLGGHCIPVDPFYLTWKAREYGVHTRFIELAGEVNQAMPRFVVDKTRDALNSHQKPVRGSKVLILGVAYKKNIDDMRESPALPVLGLLEEQGARLSYCDPHIPSLKLPVSGETLHACDLDKKLLEQQDCVVIITNHDRFDFSEVLREASLIVDSRGVYQEPHPKVMKA